MSVAEKAAVVRSAANSRQVAGRSGGMVRHKVSVKECVKLFGIEVRSSVDTEEKKVED